MAKHLKSLINAMLDIEASDLFITVDAPASAKVDGKVRALNNFILDNQAVHQLVNEAMQWGLEQDFDEAIQEANFAIEDGEIGRFRVNVFKQRGFAGMVLRHIKSEIPNVEQLGLPILMKDLVMEKKGLIIMVGATGSGKSTSLAAMVDHRNKNDQGHILSVEDPIEFVHQHHKSIITQREVGVDTESFEIALKNALREAPDVILIGEIRSKETMELAINFSETGHLCLATLHANNANQAIDRIVNFFPEERHSQLFSDLSLNLKAIISQRLIPKKEDKGRAVAVEVLLNTPRVSDLIRKAEVHEIKEVMGHSNEQGMQTFDQALFHLYVSQEISYEQALKSADSENDLRIMIKLHGDEDHDKSSLDGVKVLD